MHKGGGCNRRILRYVHIIDIICKLCVCIEIWYSGACPAGGSGGSSTPLRSGTTAANLVLSCVKAIVTDKQQLVAKTNNKLTGLTLNSSFSSLLGLKQPSLSSSCLQERVNEGRGQRLGAWLKILCTRFARVWLSTSLPQILDTPWYWP